MMINTIKVLILLKKVLDVYFSDVPKNKIQIYIIKMLNLEMKKLMYRNKISIENNS
jgi:hypothetical protein